MKHREALATLERIFNETYLPEVCERVMLNHKRIQVQLVEQVSFHSNVKAGMPCIIQLNIEARGADINTVLLSALQLVKKQRLDQPFPLVPKEYYRSEETGKKWARRTVDKARHTGTQSVIVDVIPRSDVEYEEITIRRARDKVSGLVVETTETVTDFKKLSPSLWVALTEKVREWEQEQDDTKVVIESETPELDKAINNVATN